MLKYNSRIEMKNKNHYDHNNLIRFIFNVLKMHLKYMGYVSNGFA